MNSNPQLERYKKLLAYIDAHLHEDINIKQVEAISHYSYRNINRIFEAIHQETIGKYIKRLRLEKGAQYLKYSEMGVSQIAYEVGFEDRAAFSKAFKNKYGCAPSGYRDHTESAREQIQQSRLPIEGRERQPLQFEIEYLPDFDYLFLEHRGDYQDIAAIEKTWDRLVAYAMAKNIVSDRSIFFTEIVDDAEISDHINTRFNQGFILEQPLPFEPEAFFRTKTHKRQKYAKFTHQGSYESSLDFHQELFAFWIVDVALELEDLPCLEFYPNYHEHPPADEMLTEIYIPVT